VVITGSVFIAAVWSMRVEIQEKFKEKPASKPISKVVEEQKKKLEQTEKIENVEKREVKE